MKRILLTIATAVVLAGVIFFARSDSAGQGKAPVDPNAIQAAQGEQNPWTSLKVNSDPEQFSFAVVADRTGGNRGKAFEQAVGQLNLLQPQFVMSVGDLIEGFNDDPKIIAAEWNEFQRYVKKLEMPFFYVAGNHDLVNNVQIAAWDKRFGKRFYHFLYKNVLFLVLNCETFNSGNIDAKQQAWASKLLEAHKDVRWTFVFVHRPQLWWPEYFEKSGWKPIEKALEGRKYNVFVGHQHHYATYERNGMLYYQLATTGGESRVRGPDYREVDHFAWVTMKKEAPVVAQVLLDGVLTGDLKKPASKEEGVVREKRHPVEGKLTIDGAVEKTVLDAKTKQMKGEKVASRVTITFFTEDPKTKKYTAVADGLTDAWGRFQISTYNRFDGCPAGKYTVTAAKTGNGYYDGDVPAEKQLPKQYLDPKTSPLRATIKAGLNEVKLDVVTK